MESRPNTARPQAGESDGHGHICCQRWTVNKRLLPLKLFYFFFYGAAGAMNPFLTVYLKSLHMTASEVGIISGLAVVLAMFARPALSLLADRLASVKLTLVICCMGFGTSFFLLWFLPARELNSVISVNGAAHVMNNTGSPVTQLVWSCRDDQDLELCRYAALDSGRPCLMIPGSRRDVGSSFITTSSSLSNDFSTSGPPRSRDEISKTSHSHSEGKISRANIYSMDKILRTPARSMDETTRTSSHVMDTISRTTFRSEKDTISLTTALNKDEISLTTALTKGEISLTTALTKSEISTSRSRKSLLLSTIHPVSSYNFDSWVWCYYVGAMSNSSRDTTSEELPDRKSVSVSGHQSASEKNGLQSQSECLTRCVLESEQTSLDVNNSRFQSNRSGPSVSESVYEYSTITVDYIFCLSFLMFTVGRAFYSSSTSLLDTVTYTLLGNDRFRWGRQRLWGTVGTAAAIGAVIVVNHGYTDTRIYTGQFWTSVVLSSLSTLVAALKLKAHKIQNNPSVLQDMGQVLSQPAFRLFLTKLIFYGAYCGAAQNFFLWYMADLGASQTTLGLTVLIHCTSSAIILRFTSRILKRIGQQRAMYLVLAVYAVRFLLFSFLQSAWIALPVEVLHGMTYSFFWAAASSTVSLTAPTGTKATCQGLAGAVYWDLGRGVGTLIMGQLLEVMEAHWVFRFYSITCFVQLPLFWLLDRKWPTKQSKIPQNITEMGQVNNSLLGASASSPTREEKSLSLNSAAGSKPITVTDSAPPGGTRTPEDMDVPTDVSCQGTDGQRLDFVVMGKTQAHFSSVLEHNNNSKDLPQNVGISVDLSPVMDESAGVLNSPEILSGRPDSGSLLNKP